ncbi:hypothetical protein [Ancylobacter oerskovii]|uniref:Uncharacterized protein n=1 Tax=Ancylobacter oerskovii TaxID=459519 RepID=A0ABW4Z1D3_9HYPH|nr:hypothetical protein [Ancylobacter oerskovii]MBS7542552.1 hypothetical protein [Ancylobacter oerskovii]
MVQRSKRTLAGAEQMQKDLRQFHHLVRQWAGEVPIGTNVYIGCDFLNYAIIMMDMQLTAAIQKAPYERPPGFQGLE